MNRPRIVYRDRPKKGGGCAMFMAFVCGLFAIGAFFTGHLVGVVLFMGLAMLCVLSGIFQRMK